MRAFSERPRRLNPTVLTLVLGMIHFVLGMTLLDDFGVPVDEPGNIHKGNVVLDYILASVGWLEGDSRTEAISTWDAYGAKYYGTSFEMTMAACTRILGLEDSREIILFRHSIVFSLFCYGAGLFFLTLRAMYSSSLLAACGWLMLVFHPRIFSNSFYNHKDLVFLSATLWVFWAWQRCMSKLTMKTALVFSIFAAIATSVRIMGVGLLGIGIVLLILQEISRAGIRGLLRLMVPLGTIFSAFAVTLFAVWPYLWADPIHRFTTAFSQMAQYNLWDGTVLFFGKWISSAELPWDYVVRWIAITTPEVILLLGGAGFVVITCQCLLPRAGNRFESLCLQQAYLLAWFLGPICAVILLDSILYDGWRQLYFVYPGLVGAAVTCLAWLARLLSNRRGRASNWVPLVIVALGMLPSSLFLLRNHPSGNVYFNRLAPSPLIRSVELDYWGLGIRKALEWLAEKEEEGPLKVYGTYWTHSFVRANLQLLSPGLRERFILEPSMKEADFLISNFRGYPNNRLFDVGEFPFDEPLYVQWAGDAPVSGVFAIKGEDHHPMYSNYSEENSSSDH